MNELVFTLRVRIVSGCLLVLLLVSGSSYLADGWLIGRDVSGVLLGLTVLAIFVYSMHISRSTPLEKGPQADEGHQ